MTSCTREVCEICVETVQVSRDSVARDDRSSSALENEKCTALLYKVLPEMRRCSVCLKCQKSPASSPATLNSQRTHVTVTHVQIAWSEVCGACPAHTRLLTDANWNVSCGKKPRLMRSCAPAQILDSDEGDHGTKTRLVAVVRCADLRDTTEICCALAGFGWTRVVSARSTLPHVGTGAVLWRVVPRCEES